MKRLFAYFSVVMVCGVSWAFQYNGLDYTILNKNADGTYNVSVRQGASAPAGTLNIPGTIRYNGDEFVVTHVATDGFNNCGDITSLSLPNTIIEIGARGFRSCTALTSVNLPEGLRVLGNRAFCNDSALVGTVTIPSTVDSIGDYAFYLCNKVTTFDIQTLTPPAIEITSSGSAGTAVFIHRAPQPDFQIACGTRSLYQTADYWGQRMYLLNDACREFEVGELRYAAISPTTCRVLGYALGGGNSEHFNTELNIPEQVEYTGGTLQVTEIGSSAFEESEVTFTSVVLPSTLRKIGTKAFRSCMALTSVQLNEGLRVIGNRAFCNDALIAGTLTIPSTVDSIGDYAFYYNSQLTDIQIASPEVHLESNADGVCNTFAGYKGSISIPCGSHISYYGDAVCWETYRSRLEDPCQEDFDDGILKYRPNGAGTAAVVGYINGKIDGELVIPAEVTYNGQILSVNAVADNVFNNKGLRLTSVVFPHSMRTIGAYAFRSCTQLTSVQLNEGLRVIGNRAFCNDSALVGTLAIPATVDSIADFAFYMTYKLDKLVMQSATPPAMEGKQVFNGLGKGKVLLPCGSGATYKSHPVWQYFLNTGLATDLCGRFTIGALIYEGIEAGNVIVTGYVPELLPAHLAIPKSIEYNGQNLQVTEIGQSAFEWNGTLTSLVIPSSVSHIATKAFRSCTRLQSLTLSEGIRVIGNRAFCNDSALVGTLTIPASVDSIGDFAFGTNENRWKYITALEMQKQTPPAVELSDDGITFSAINGIPTTANIAIPCGSKTAYRGSAFWRRYTYRFDEGCPPTPLNIYHYNYPNTGHGLTRYTGGKVTDITYSRIFTPDTWETLYLPFEVTSVSTYDDGEKYDISQPYEESRGGFFFLAKQVGNDEDGYPLFEYTSTIEANVPYIIRFPSDYYQDRTIVFSSNSSPKNITNSGFSQAANNTAAQMYGNTTWTDQHVSGVYLLHGDNTFHIHNDSEVLHPFECYVTLRPKAEVSAPAAQRMMIRFRETSTPTDNTAPMIESGAIAYTLNGSTLNIQTQGKALKIYTTSGVLLHSFPAGETTAEVRLAPGCYIIQTQDGSLKIVL